MTTLKPATAAEIEQYWDPGVMAVRQGRVLRFIAVGQPCVVGSSGVCIVCDAPPGEPCRRQSVEP